ncbi:uncharacterized protein LOC62_02G003452 [Vanrija pseudolonga]|uniref:Uncharacterized protein n=1 Tax=Vanrija pseudolonga TaxID=143232 RepID=A0AAF0Y457_9TREE|nr:hypothetical protein LOC62_02G003452 [Vanrija pseudolonga]
MLSTSTLTHLAVAAAVVYRFLGVWDLLAPGSAARVFLGLRSPSPKDTDDDAQSDAIPTLVPMLGARDVTVGAAILWLAHEAETHALGVVVLSASALNFVDAWAVARRRGAVLGAAPALFSLAFVGLGYGLLVGRG